MIPSLVELRGSVVSTRWLSQQLSTPAIDASEVTLELNTHGFILALLGSFLFAEKGSAFPPLFIPTTTRFDTNIYLQLG